MNDGYGDATRMNQPKSDKRNQPREFQGQVAVASSKSSAKAPILYVGGNGTISVIMNMGVIIEIAADRAMRVLCHDKFSSSCNSTGTTACILHPNARIFQQGEKVFCNFATTPYTSNKSAVFGAEGVLFTMSHLGETYFVSSSAVKGTASVPSVLLQFPNLNHDFTLRHFYSECQTGQEFTNLCNDIVKRARYGTRNDDSLMITINDIYIKQEPNGNVEVNCRPRHISCSPTNGTIRVRTDLVDMAVQVHHTVNAYSWNFFDSFRYQICFD
ncbi:unnamed protein product [Anisakis simplex]|uniref:Uncharacterized protein n=1 Tax=Anisakis simplex TaxID=6269 RepID=A0A3P6NTX2_ANISI|nr:unnamed protein product [Anisakis simplex]